MEIRNYLVELVFIVDMWINIMMIIDCDYKYSLW